MGDLNDMMNALSDSFVVAVGSFNPLPVVILSLIVGLFQSNRARLSLKALAVALPSLAIAAVLPFFSGIDPSIPDLFSPEFQIQAIISLLIAFAIIAILGGVKSALSLTARGVSQDITHLKP